MSLPAQLRITARLSVTVGQSNKYEAEVNERREREKGQYAPPTALIATAEHFTAVVEGKQ